MRPVLFMVTPAYRRYEMTDLCLAQRRRACDRLALAGIDATCVVVANDENCDIARSHGFEVSRMSNLALGRKFSRGIVHGLKAGATHTMSIGSDSWVDPAVITRMDFAPDRCAGTELLTTLRPDGLERLEMTIRYPAGFGVMTLYPRAATEGERFPCHPDIHSGCDTSTWNRTARERGFPVDFVRAHAREYTDFKSYDVQTTAYHSLEISRWVTRRVGGAPAIDELRMNYDGDLVDRLAAMYAGRQPWEQHRVVERLGTLYVG